MFLSVVVARVAVCVCVCVCVEKQIIAAKAPYCRLWMSHKNEGKERNGVVNTQTELLRVVTAINPTRFLAVRSRLAGEVRRTAYRRHLSQFPRSPLLVRCTQPQRTGGTMW